jgi:hypothetical protein
MSTCAKLGASAFILTIVIGLELALAIPAVVIAEQHEHESCIGSYSGISFPYGIWLKVFGWTQIGAVLATIVFGALSIVCEMEAASAMIILTNVLSGFFHFCWFIVGAVLYFKEVSPNCPSGTPLYDFGLALFIIQCIAWGGACCGGSGKASSSNSSRV